MLLVIGLYREAVHRPFELQVFSHATYELEEDGAVTTKTSTARTIRLANRKRRMLISS